MDGISVLSRLGRAPGASVRATTLSRAGSAMLARLAEKALPDTSVRDGEKISLCQRGNLAAVQTAAPRVRTTRLVRIQHCNRVSCLATCVR